MSATTDSAGRQWVMVSTLAVLTVLWTIALGPLGLAVGLTTAVTWYGLGTPYAIAAGHVILVAGTESLALETILIVGLGFLAVVLVPIVTTSTLRVVAVTLASFASFIGLAWLVARTQPLWVAAASVALAITLTTYACHRYERVRLGLVPEAATETTSIDQ